MVPLLVRKGLDPWLARMDPQAPEPETIFDLDLAADGSALPTRLYRPHEATGDLLVFFHGGGLVSGSIDTHDGVCRRLCEGAGVNVLSVGHRLAPEHPYPAAWDDADAASTLAARGKSLPFRPTRLFLGGDSAGGLLASAVMRRWARRGAPPPHGLILFYPLLGIEPVADDPWLLRWARRWIHRHAIAGQGAVHATDIGPHWMIDGPLPRLFIASGGNDPARPDAERLIVTLGRREGDVVHFEPHGRHGWLNLAGLSPAARRQTDRTIQALKAFLT
ncbi:MAG: alpha/beta hydrolase fold domain-containing protein [Caulobacter sp.]|nr:alpha/beta hydrolase fold domain-containing protein [Caulobacter sp.]